MFENVGRKIKGFAKVICVLGIIAPVIYAFSIILAFTSTSIFQRETSVIIAALLYLIVGPLVSWLLSLFIYGFGELVESAENKKE